MRSQAILSTDILAATCYFYQAGEIGIKSIDFIDKIIEVGFKEHEQNSASRNKGAGIIALTFVLYFQ